MSYDSNKAHAYYLRNIDRFRRNKRNYTLKVQSDPVLLAAKKEQDRLYLLNYRRDKGVKPRKLLTDEQRCQARKACKLRYEAKMRRARTPPLCCICGRPMDSYRRKQCGLIECRIAHRAQVQRRYRLDAVLGPMRRNKSRIAAVKYRSDPNNSLKAREYYFTRPDLFRRNKERRRARLRLEKEISLGLQALMLPGAIGRKK